MKALLLPNNILLFGNCNSRSAFGFSFFVSSFLGTKCTHFQYNYAIQLAILKHLYFNFFCVYFQLFHAN